MKQIKYLTTVILLIFLLGNMTINTKAAPAFASSPEDIEISSDDDLTLTWSISDFSGVHYNVYMEYSGNTSLVSSGVLTEAEINVELNQLSSGEYLFACSIQFELDVQWSNITISVSSGENETNNENSEDSGINFPVLGFSLFFTTPILIRNKKRS